MDNYQNRDEIQMRDVGPASKPATSSKSHSPRNKTGSSESTTTPKKYDDESVAEEIRQQICMGYMGISTGNAGNPTSEQDFENAAVIAKSPIVKSRKYHSSELSQAGRDLPLPRNKSSSLGSLLPFILHVTLSTKLMSLFHIYMNINGGWYFFIPVVIWTVVLVGPIAFFEISLGQFSSELSGSIFPKINRLLIGVSQLMIVSRVAVMLAINTEHRYFSLILETFGELIFQPRKTICYQQNSHFCYISGHCENGDDVFYQGGCYNPAELVKNKAITAEGAIRLGVAKLWKELFEKYPYARASPSIKRILDEDNYSHKIDAIFLLFLVCFICSNMGIRKFKKCSKVFLIYFCLTLLAILGHLLITDSNSGFKSLQRFVQYTRSDITKLYTFETWLNALTLVVIAHGVGDGTLHALGSMNPFNTDSQVISFCISMFSLVTIVFGTFIFGYMQIPGSDRYLMDTGVAITPEALEDIKSRLRRSISFLKIFYDYTYANPWAKLIMLTFYVAAIIAQVSNHVLMAENFYTSLLNWFPQLTKVNVKVMRHCAFAVYYIIIGFLYYFLQYGFDDHSYESFYLLKCVLLASVFWECFAVAKFYSMGRFLVNIRTMFAFSTKLYTRIRTMTPLFYYLWTFILPFICALMFICALFCEIRLTELDSALIITVLVAFLPVWASVRLITLRLIRHESIDLFVHRSSLTPIKITDMKDAAFDEKAARIIL